MQLVIHGDPRAHGVTELALLHIAPEPPFFDAERDADQLFAILKERLHPATFDALATLFQACEVA